MQQPQKPAHTHMHTLACTRMHTLARHSHCRNGHKHSQGQQGWPEGGCRGHGLCLSGRRAGCGRAATSPELLKPSGCGVQATPERTPRFRLTWNDRPAPGCCQSAVRGWARSSRTGPRSGLGQRQGRSPGLGMESGLRRLQRGLSFCLPLTA